ncbi:hypothetical protein FQZ97_1027250 [compost metagenome]
MVAIGQGHVIAISAGTGIELVFIQALRPIAVERQLLATVDDRLVVAIQAVLGLTQLAQMVIELAHQQPADAQGETHPQQRHHEQPRRQPGQVGKRRQGQHPAVKQLRQVHERQGDVADIAGQAGDDGRPTDGLQALDRRVQHPLHQGAAQAVDETMAQGRER